MSSLSTLPRSRMEFDDALRFWYARVNYEQKAANPSDLKLDRMRTLLDLLGNPHERLRVVHIAGSKGKGSTSAMLAAVLREAGFRTGLFTSPHLERVHERIQVDGTSITDAEMASLLSEIANACAGRIWPTDANGDAVPLAEALTFFEIATALGFLHLVRRRVDFAVLEVGLGGRFDSTNVCRPMVSIITSISFDHMKQLGNTLNQIAFEKAGIIKPGRPVLSGVLSPGPRSVIEEIAGERQAPLFQMGRDFTFTHEPGLISAIEERAPVLQVTTRKRRWPRLELGLLGAHQAANAALVVSAMELLERQGVPIPDRAIAKGLANVHWPARLEVLGRRPTVVLDCAHNLASAQALIDTLAESIPLPEGARRHLIFAGATDKDLAGMLKLLRPMFSHVYLTRYSNNPRATGPMTLAEHLPAKTDYSIHETAEDAWKEARRAAHERDLICVTGSVFLAGEMRPLILGSRD